MEPQATREDPAVNAEDDLSFSKHELVKQCQDLEANLRELRAEAASSSQQSMAVSGKSAVSPDSPAGKLLQLRQEECLLRESLIGLQKCEPCTFSADEQVLRLHVVADLRATVAGLKEGIKTVDKNIKELEESLALNTSHIEQFDSTAERLNPDRTAEHHAAPKPSTSKDPGQAKSEVLKMMKQCYKAVEGTLAEFLDEYFPEFSEEESPPRDAGKAKMMWEGDEWERHFDHDSRPVRSLSVAEMIEELLHAMFRNPANPYIPLTRRHWAPYTALLLRVGIAEKHPTDSQFIRLVPVHDGL